MQRSDVNRVRSEEAALSISLRVPWDDMVGAGCADSARRRVIEGGAHDLSQKSQWVNESMSSLVHWFIAPLTH